MGSRINTIMQTCFFAISGVLPKDEAIEQIKKAIKKTYGSKGEEVVKKNYEAVDQTLENLHKIDVPAKSTSTFELPLTVSDKAPDYVKQVLARLLEERDDVRLRCRLMDIPTASTQWEREILLLKFHLDPEIVSIAVSVHGFPHASIR